MKATYPEEQIDVIFLLCYLFVCNQSGYRNGLTPIPTGVCVHVCGM